MGIFIKVLQGSYAYLLIFEIVVVSLLFLTFLWMLVRRIREAEATDEVELSPSPRIETAQPQPTVPAAVAAVVEANKTLQDLKTQITVLEEEPGKADSLNHLNEELREKVRYLESKLLEYEILQEEIGTLSTLKAQNEELRQQLVLSGKTPPNPTSEGERTPSEPSTMNSGTAVGVESADRGDYQKEPILSSTFSSTPPSESEPKKDDLHEMTVSFSEKTIPHPTSQAEPVKQASAPEAVSIAGLEKLLSQIDELTK